MNLDDLRQNGGALAGFVGAFIVIVGFIVGFYQKGQKAYYTDIQALVDAAVVKKAAETEASSARKSAETDKEMAELRAQIDLQKRRIDSYMKGIGSAVLLLFDLNTRLKEEKDQAAVREILRVLQQEH